MQSFAQEDVQLIVYKKRNRLSVAFDLLKQWHPTLQTYVISEDTWTRLIKFMHKNMDSLKMRALFVVLTDGEPHISEFNLSEHFKNFNINYLTVGKQ